MYAFKQTHKINSNHTKNDKFVNRVSAVHTKRERLPIKNMTCDCKVKPAIVF